MRDGRANCALWVLVISVILVGILSAVSSPGVAYCAFASNLKSSNHSQRLESISLKLAIESWLEIIGKPGHVGGGMVRERVLKTVLVVLGLLFVAAIYPISGGVRHPNAPGENTTDTMMLSIYFALGVFLLLAVRNPSSHRSLIAFAAWANIAHATVMGLMSIRLVTERPDMATRQEMLTGTAIFGVIGLILLVARHYLLAVGRATAPERATGR